MRERDRLFALRKRGADPDPKAKSLAKPRESKPFSLRNDFERKLLQAGIERSARVYIGLSGMIIVLITVVLSQLGLFLGIFGGGAAGFYLFTIYLDERATKRKKKIVPLLAPFIDAVASALATGFNIDGAVIQATHSVPPGLLASELERVSSAVNQGLSVKEAMSSFGERFSGEEVKSLVTAISLFSSMGGSVLDSFRRLSEKIRGQQSVIDRATRDMVMVRQSFNIIFGLIFVVPLTVALVGAEYFSAMLTDPLGRVMLQVGGMIAISMVVIFRSITNMKV